MKAPMKYALLAFAVAVIWCGLMAGADFVFCTGIFAKAQAQEQPAVGEEPKPQETVKVQEMNRSARLPAEFIQLRISDMKPGDVAYTTFCNFYFRTDRDGNLTLDSTAPITSVVDVNHDTKIEMFADGVKIELPGEPCKLTVHEPKHLYSIKVIEMVWPKSKNDDARNETPIEPEKK